MVKAMNAIKYSVENGIGWITLNRPDSINAINEDIRRELPLSLVSAERDLDVKVIVISGEGERGFCAGADVNEFAEPKSSIEMRNERLHEHWVRVFEKLNKPVVAAIHGYCLGGGLELAMACDIRLAATDAVLGLPELSRGVIPGAGGTQRLSRLVGLGLALDMILTSKRISGEEAKNIGLVTRVYAASELFDEALKLAGEIAGKAPLATRYAKEAIYKGYDLPMSAALTLELDLASFISSSEDRLEAGRAFKEKRKPVFKGR
jgi:enoyl-CoA hydratase